MQSCDYFLGSQPRTIGEILDKCNFIRRIEHDDWEETTLEFYKCSSRKLVMDLIHHYSRFGDLGHIDLGCGDTFILVFVNSYGVTDLDVYTIR